MISRRPRTKRPRPKCRRARSSKTPSRHERALAVRRRGRHPRAAGEALDLGLSLDNEADVKITGIADLSRLGEIAEGQHQARFVLQNRQRAAPFFLEDLESEIADEKIGVPRRCRRRPD